MKTQSPQRQMYTLILGLAYACFCLRGFCADGVRPVKGPNLALPTKIVPIGLNRSWTETGITIREGQRIIIKTDGILHWFSFQHPNYLSTPDGQHTAVNGLAAPRLAAWSLIGKIGSGEPFQVGSNFDDISTTNGVLLLGVNDTYYEDNTGDWKAHITVGDEPPQSGDILVYTTGGTLFGGHVALLIPEGFRDNKDGTFTNISVQSKWGPGAIFRHPMIVYMEVIGDFIEGWDPFRRFLI